MDASWWATRTGAINGRLGCRKRRAAQQGTSPFAQGLVEPGNVELWKRPVLHNADGSYSTTRSLSFDEDGHEVLVPTVVDGKQLTPTEAIRRYRQTGEHLGKFSSPETADRYAETLHNAQAANYDNDGNPLGSQSAGEWDVVHEAPHQAPKADFSQFKNTHKPVTTRSINIGPVGPEAPGMETRQSDLLGGIAVGAVSGVPGIAGDVEALGRAGLSYAGVPVATDKTFAWTSKDVGNFIAGEPSSEEAAEGRGIGVFASPSFAAKSAELIAGGLRVADKIVSRMSGPFTDAGRERMAGERIAQAATDLPSVQSALDKPQEIVPGSKPTTFQATGDMGLGSLERESQTKFPAELDKLQQSGDPADFVDYVKGQMRWLDGETANDVTSATRVAQQRAERVGGARTPDEYGADLRASAQASEDAQERALWEAVDPDGTLTVSTGPIRTAARTIGQDMSRSAKPISGEERGIMDIALAYTPNEPFREIGDLRSRISTAMREELRASGRTPVYGRLTRLRGAVERAIQLGVEQQAQAAPQALANGFARFAEEARNWSRNSRVGDAGDVTYDATGTGGVSSVQGTRSANRGRPGDAADYQGIPEAPTFDAEAAERLRLANDATRNRADTFQRGPVGQTLAKGGRQDLYRLPDSAVPDKIFHPGPRGFEDVEAFRRAAGDDHAFVVLQDAAAASLRRAAMRADGTLDPARVAPWAAKHREALRAFPALQDRFQSAASASEALADAAASRKRILDDYQSGTLGKVIGLNDPSDISRTIGGIFSSRNATQQMADLARTARRNPDAMEGLRKAVADHIQQKLIGNTEAAASGQAQIKSDAFQTFVRQNRKALAQVFSPEEVSSLQTVADDLQRANRSLTAVKTPGQSNTAQDMLASEKGGGTVLGKLIAEGASSMAGAVGAAASGTLSGGAMSWLGARTISIMRDAGIQRVDELVRDAMLNPELAKALLSKVPDKPGAMFQSIFATRLKKALQAGVASGALNRANPAGDGSRAVTGQNDPGSDEAAVR